MKKIIPFYNIHPFVLRSKNDPDVLIVNEEMGVLKKEMIELIHEFIIHSPVQSSRRMVLLLSLDRATVEFQNSLLKDLEDSDADFIMSADDLSRVLSTVKSRCSVETSHKVSYEDLMEYAKKRDYPFSFDLFAYSGGFIEAYEGLMNEDPEVLEALPTAFRTFLTSGNPDALFKAFGLCPEGQKSLIEKNRGLMPLVLSFFDVYALAMMGFYPQSEVNVNVETGSRLAMAVQSFKARLLSNPGKGDLFTFVREICSIPNPLTETAR